ncbi:hypothetical protein TSTA_097870 [Talaromyces stipitatus ATCC 10500]|uniref:Uncharacterized protein n=1 Tax=Talaromyces stipitatus (strain ATCC 10500 / CBS 375.48 / QM 6759 / NRRL 1006) TaxID=441959 RepID=B8MM19_TALSN|nr:uncharacterized protein TSTA_097870 [Talaromyces stipitatus ATCC 10500]EED13531.1 hypothetical protein TSTA_097870 [Talaromyces stipitatus ATCC 10500]
MSEVLSKLTTKFETLVSRLRAKAAIMQKKKAARSTLEKPVEGIARHLRDHSNVKTVKIMALDNEVTANVGYRHAEGKANASDKTYRAFLMDFEAGYNITLDSEDEEETNNNDKDEVTAYFMAFLHWITGEETEQDNPSTIASQFVIDQHDSKIFHGILPDTGAARVLMVGRRQLTALQKIYPGIMVDKSRAGEHSIRFGQGDSVDSEGAVTIKTPIGNIDFHVMNTPTPFLLCITDMDRHEAYLDNTTNCLVKGDLRVPIVQK